MREWKLDVSLYPISEDRHRDLRVVIFPINEADTMQAFEGFSAIVVGGIVPHCRGDALDRTRPQLRYDAQDPLFERSQAGDHAITESIGHACQCSRGLGNFLLCDSQLVQRTQIGLAPHGHYHLSAQSTDNVHVTGRQAVKLLDRCGIERNVDLGAEITQHSFQIEQSQRLKLDPPGMFRDRIVPAADLAAAQKKTRCRDQNDSQSSIAGLLDQEAQ
jgi:hypothetical protein